MDPLPTKPSPSAYVDARRRHLNAVLHDRTILLREILRAAWYLVWWLGVLPWGFIVPATLLWTYLASGDPSRAIAFFSGGWRDVSTGVVSVAFVAVTLLAAGLRPYHSAIAEALDLKMDEWLREHRSSRS